MDIQGVCPACEAVALDYSPVQTDDSGVHYPWECQSCEARGKEYYTIEFSHHDEMSAQEIEEQITAELKKMHGDRVKTGKALSKRQREDK